MIKKQMAQYGQLNPSDKELDEIAARIFSNQEETKRLSDQLMSQKLLDFYKNANLKVKKEPETLLKRPTELHNKFVKFLSLYKTLLEMNYGKELKNTPLNITALVPCILIKSQAA